MAQLTCIYSDEPESLNSKGGRKVPSAQGRLGSRDKQSSNPRFRSKIGSKAHRYFFLQNKKSQKHMRGSNSFKNGARVENNKKLLKDGEHTSKRKEDDSTAKTSHVVNGYLSDQNILDKTFKTANDPSPVPAENWNKFILCNCESKNECW